MNWNYLKEEEELNKAIEDSAKRSAVIFKSSFSCGISAMALDRLEKSQQPEDIDFYMVDVIRERPLSRKIAETFKVTHQSPQVLLIQNGQCTYHASHHSINMDKIIREAA